MNRFASLIVVIALVLIGSGRPAFGQAPDSVLRQLNRIIDATSSGGKSYTLLFDAYLDMTELAEQATVELNTAYFAYGTKRELKDNGVITKEGGFIGIGKTSKLKNDFNDNYFEKIDITQKKEITIVGRKPELVTSHPSSSFKLEQGDESSKLTISDPEKFWGASKYLVIVVQ